MIEAVNKKMKYEFLFPKNIVSFEEVIDTLKIAVPKYNSRPSGVLFGFSPQQTSIYRTNQKGRCNAA